MSADENTRLQIRQHFIELMDERLADAIMESMPPIPWTELATKDDIARLDGRFDMVDVRFDKMDDRFDKMDDRFDKMDDRFDKMDDRFDKMDDRFDGSDEQFVSITQQFMGLNQRFEGQTNEIQASLLALEGRLGMRFMEATRLMVFALLLLMTGVIATVMAVSDFS